MILENYQKRKEFIYFPSFDTGVAARVGVTNPKLNNGTPWRFWSHDFPTRYRHPYFLTTAGHSYKKMDHVSKYEFTDDTIVLGDSGGFQVCSGAIEWEESLLPKMFNWLENNSHVAMNLDIPPRRKYEGKFTECLNISMDNFRYFADHQTGKTQYLNVLHGSTYDKYLFWYNHVKDFPFDGWAAGGATGSISAIIDALCVLVKNREHLNPRNKWLHILGCSSVSEFLLLAKIQHALERVGSNIQVCTDSSTPSRSTSYGYWYTGYDIKNMVFKYIHIPRRDKLRFPDELLVNVPHTKEIDIEIFKTYTLSDIVKYKTDHYGWMIIHNMLVFLDCYKESNELVRCDPYIQDQLFTKNWMKIMNSIDMIVDSSNPIYVANIHRPMYIDADRLTRSSFDSPDNEFF